MDLAVAERYISTKLDEKEVQSLYFALADRSKSADQTWRVQIAPKTFAVSTGSQSVKQVAAGSSAETSMAAIALLAASNDFDPKFVKSVCTDITFRSLIDQLVSMHKPTNLKAFNFRLSELQELLGQEVHRLLSSFGTNTQSPTDKVEELQELLPTPDELVIPTPTGESVFSVYTISETKAVWQAITTTSDAAKLIAEVRNLERKYLVVVLEHELDNQRRLLSQSPISLWSPDDYGITLEEIELLSESNLGKHWYIDEQPLPVAPQSIGKKAIASTPPRVSLKEPIYQQRNHPELTVFEVGPSALETHRLLAQAWFQAAKAGDTEYKIALNDENEIVVVIGDSIAHIESTLSTALNTLRVIELRILFESDRLINFQTNRAIRQIMLSDEGIAAWVSNTTPDNWFDIGTSMDLQVAACFKAANEIVRSALQGSNTTYLRRFVDNHSMTSGLDKQFVRQTVMQTAIQNTDAKLVRLVSLADNTYIEAPLATIQSARGRVQTSGSWVIIDPETKSYYKCAGRDLEPTQVDSLAARCTPKYDLNGLTISEAHTNGCAPDNYTSHRGL